MKIGTRRTGLTLAPVLLLLGWQPPLQARETQGMLTVLNGRVELETAAGERRGLDPILARPVALDLEKQRIELRTAGVVMRQLNSKIDALSHTGPRVAGNPVLRWKKLPGVELYRVRLEQSRGSILLDLPVSGDRLERPPAVSLPPERRCRWHVESEGNGPPALSPWMQFATLSAAEQQRLAGVLQSRSIKSIK